MNTTSSKIDNSETNIDNKIAVVTGAGSGVGRHSALALLKDGFHVVLAGRRLAALEETAKQSDTSASRVLAISTDVNDHDSVKNLFARINDEFGRLDVLFNNAGIGSPPVPLEDLPLDQWQEIINTNLTGPFLCTQEAIKIMKGQNPIGGRIINNGSVSADRPRPNSAPYTAAKHAITGLTKSTSLDARKYNIACGQIDIGNALTDMSSRVKQGVLQADGSVVAEPMMDVTNVARAVAYMASLPLDANVQFMTVMATKMPLIGRG